MITELFNSLKESGIIPKEGRLVKSRLSNSRVSVFDDKISSNSYFYFVNEEGEVVRNFIYKMKPETLLLYNAHEAKISSTNAIFRLYPLTDFEMVEVISEEELLKEDAPISELTVRDVAALLLRKPISNKNWLNKCIKS
jgi:hypothetical protein